MSCKIDLLSDETFESTNSSGYINSKRASKLSLSARINLVLSFARRLLYFRKLRLLKLYMAIIFTLFILYIVISHHHVSNQDVEHQGKESNTNANHDLKPSLPETPKQSHLNSLTRLPIRPQHLNNFSMVLTQSDFSKMKDVNLMQVTIREAMKHSWDNYKRYAWGFDLLKPRAKEPDHWFELGLTIVDSVDTLIMMGLEHDANDALDWIENELKFDSNNENSNCFEMTIRILGGLLTAYHLTGREKILHQSIRMGDILLHCYDTDSKVIPFSDININTKQSHPPPWNPHSSLSEVASLQLENRYLSFISKNPSFEDKTFATSMHLHNLTARRIFKLLPMYINPNSGELEESIITLGARTDSYYEYLLKQYIQTGIKWLEQDYLDSIDAIRDKLISHTNGKKNYTYVDELTIHRNAQDKYDLVYTHKMDHLVCFLPGTLALGYYHFSPLASEQRLKFNLETPEFKLSSRYNYHMQLAEDLARTCFHMYSDMGTGLSPEIANFVHINSENQNESELTVQSTSAHNLLRPEYVETLFYLYHITGYPKYQQQAKQIFDSFQKYSRIPSGYSPISDVRSATEARDIAQKLHEHAPDRMESFWLSETLKYLYLIFCEDQHIVGTLLNNYVFNTEAHILPIMSDMKHS